MKMRQMAARNYKKLYFLWKILQILLYLILPKLLALNSFLFVRIFYHKNGNICEVSIDTLHTLRGLCCSFGFNFYG